MRWPALVLVGLGRFVWLPFPVIILWPLVVLVWCFTLCAGLFPRSSRARSLLQMTRGIIPMLSAITGLSVSVRPTEGSRIRVFII